VNVLHSLLNESEFVVGIPTVSPSGSTDLVGIDFLEHRGWPLTHCDLHLP
jgi:hypothetical protein